MSVMNPPKGVIDQVHKILAKKFWGHIIGVKGKHWVVWETLCLPKSKGWCGF